MALIGTIEFTDGYSTKSLEISHQLGGTARLSSKSELAAFPRQAVG